MEVKLILCFSRLAPCIIMHYNYSSCTHCAAWVVFLHMVVTLVNIPACGDMVLLNLNKLLKTLDRINEEIILSVSK